MLMQPSPSMSNSAAIDRNPPMPKPIILSSGSPKSLNRKLEEKTKQLSANKSQIGIWGAAVLVSAITFIFTYNIFEAQNTDKKDSQQNKIFGLALLLVWSLLAVKLAAAMGTGFQLKKEKDQLMAEQAALPPRDVNKPGQVSFKLALP